ncbi:hypothetical protein [Pseudoxanthomonas sp. JBR18]|uniref:hypothetical protein n=1 Tax=Pseudoxanthomonas sp. JBR18 TaxID=2969308 RepID=UPI0023062C90|nr:hypothetical protein [Pseudoxanthomonas sp. JBR18]WCE03178.1 hypothetical protein PJ250_13765 [Pseudoxanthomonas sp. JBR18]
MTWAEKVYTAEESQLFIDESSGLLDQVAKNLLVLARAGQLDSSNGFTIWSKMGRRGEPHSVLFDATAVRAFPALVAAIGARPVPERTVKIEPGEYSVLASSR